MGHPACINPIVECAVSEGKMDSLHRTLLSVRHESW